VATAHALNDRLRGSQLQLVAYGGHSLPRRNPQAVADAITTFTATLPPHPPQHGTPRPHAGRNTSKCAK